MSDNPLGHVLGGTMPTGSPPAPRGRWLIDASQGACFWEGEDWPPQQPAILGRLKFKGSPPRGYKLLTTVTFEGRSSRSQGTPLYTLEAFLEGISTQQRAPSDTYNPFGRFTTGASSFLPNSNCPGSVIDELAGKDKAFSKVVETSKEMATPIFPLYVRVETGEELYFSGENPFGAIYTDTPPTVQSGQIVQQRATYDADRRQDPRDSGLNLVSAPEEIRMVSNEGITSSLIGAHTGQKREKSQTQVMGASAGDAAEAAGFARNEGAGWEWLHLIAHSMGGIEVVGPQVAGNLVAGTSECNTQMIVVEEFLKDYVKKQGGSAKLMVFAKMFDPDYHIGEWIGYDFELYNQDGHAIEVFHWSFDPRSRRNPVVMENRSLRSTGREALIDGNVTPAPHLPRSEPTAHRDLPPTREPELEDIIVERMRVMEPQPFATWLAEIRASQPNGRLGSMAVSEMGDVLVAGLKAGTMSVDRAWDYVSAIGEQVTPKMAEALKKHVELWSTR